MLNKFKRLLIKEEKENIGYRIFRYALIGTFLFIGFLLGYRILFWGPYNTHKFFDSRGYYEPAVIRAIDRAIFLDYKSKEVPIISMANLNSPDHDKCSVEEILEGKIPTYQKCSLLKIGKTNNRCKTGLIDPSCRTVSIRQELWQNDTIRENIIYASLHPCDFLINPDELDKEAWMSIINSSKEKYDFFSIPYADYRMYWLGASCNNFPITQISQIFFEIYDEENYHKITEAKILEVFEANIY